MRQRVIARGWLTRSTAVRVPEIIALFWVVKGLSTAMGEATSDYLVHVMLPELAVLIGFVAFVLALLVQLSAGRYMARRYWLAVVMVGTFGTMAADVLHVGFGVPYPMSTALYAVALAAVFIAWRRTEGTLSIHSVDTPRRELFYWAAVVATFAMGTALGDLMAYTAGIGYGASTALFAGLICVPALAFLVTRSHAVLWFWTAYVLTRPLGASMADWLGKPRGLGGLGYGDGAVAGVVALLIVVLVAWLAVTRVDDPRRPRAG